MEHVEAWNKTETKQPKEYHSCSSNGRSKATLIVYPSTQSVAFLFIHLSTHPLSS